MNRVRPVRSSASVLAPEVNEDIGYDTRSILFEGREGHGRLPRFLV